jgi:hypothetical protein
MPLSEGLHCYEANGLLQYEAQPSATPWASLLPLPTRIANDLQVALYDKTTGGCRDGLHPDRVNENQGAESTLSFLMALLEMQKTEIPTREEAEQE